MENSILNRLICFKSSLLNYGRATMQYMHVCRNCNHLCARFVLLYETTLYSAVITKGAQRSYLCCSCVGILGKCVFCEERVKN